ncbi:MAG: stalk domain-containing protein [Candidatus Ornithomonoglobus sp.]
MNITYGGAVVQAADDISVTIDGKALSFDVEPQIIEDRTMVPMRAIFEALGADVYWDSISNTATGIKGSTVVIIGIGSDKLYKNDTSVELDVPAALVDGRTLVPVRAISEAFDCTVSWSDSTRTVSITTEIPDYKNEIPPYSGEPYIVVNGNKAYFDPSELTTEPFENYSELDELGRCGAAYANICKELMPTEARESIGSVKPTGWHTVKYDFVSGKYLYNRCHLIGYQLAGENANAKNLITGTRYLNVTGMLPFENMVADYVEETDNHVLYRVTPIFEGDNLVADGVLMEAESVEDNGEGVSFNVFCYNVQPGVIIDYATGDSWAE